MSFIFTFMHIDINTPVTSYMFIIILMIVLRISYYYTSQFVKNYSADKVSKLAIYLLTHFVVKKALCKYLYELPLLALKHRVFQNISRFW